MKRKTLGMAVLTALLATGCASQKVRSVDDSIEHAALAGVDAPVPVPQALTAETNTDQAPSARGTPDIARGTGRFVKPTALATPRPAVAGAGTVTLNFEDQPVEAVVKAILTDLLDVNYSIAPGVQGNVTFSTSKPVTRDEALPILETLLSWTGNAIVSNQGRYTVMPARQAVAGNVVPRLRATAPRDGLGARLFPLRFVAANEMAKLLRPFATTDAILLADPARNVIVLSGTRDELANYEATIDTFDVDWVEGMSVGVFSLDNASVGEVLPALDSVFGQKGGSPVAGLLRFIPIERTNAIVVIATRASYLEQVGEWIARIDRGGGNEPRLFVYDVRNLLASDVARYIGNIFGGSVGGDTGGGVGPMLTATTLGDDTAGGGTGGTSAGDIDEGMADTDPAFFQSASPSTQASAPGKGSSGIRITAIDANNQLMVHARPAQWADVRQAIERLDAVPLQVQIETRILEVRLRDNFRFGVQWYLEGLAGGDGEVTQPGNKQRWALGRPPGAGRPDTFYYSFLNKDLQGVVRAMQEDSNTKTLSAPSLVVVNNRQARIQVGDQIPVTQTFVSTIGGGAGNQVGQVEYKDTGVILNVRPRVNPGGLVYLDVTQEVSRAERSAEGANATIAKRKLATQVAVQSGQTVLLGGLIRQMEANGRSGVPGLSRLPVVGHLFGSTTRDDERTELLVLITPRVITNGEDAKRVSDDYRSKFRSLRPLDKVATLEANERPSPKAPVTTPTTTAKDEAG